MVQRLQFSPGMKTTRHLNLRSLLLSAAFGPLIAVALFPLISQADPPRQPRTSSTGLIDRSGQARPEIRFGGKTTIINSSGAPAVAPAPVVAPTPEVTEPVEELNGPPVPDVVKRGYVQLRVKGSEHISLRDQQALSKITGSLGYGAIVEVEVDREIVENARNPRSIRLDDILRSALMRKIPGRDIELYPVRVVTPGRNSSRGIEDDDEGMLALRYLVGTRAVEIVAADISEADRSEIDQITALQAETEAAGPSIPCRLCSRPNNPADPLAAVQDEVALTALMSDIAAYSSSKEVQDTIAHAMRKKRSRSTGNCYRYVKRALLNGGLIDDYFWSKSAKNAGPFLRERGFVNLMDNPLIRDRIKSPYDAPPGAVLVYSGGTHGHIEIRTENGFVSDYYAATARSGAETNGLRGVGRTLIGVYYKPQAADGAQAEGGNE